MTEQERKGQDAEGHLGRRAAAEGTDRPPKDQQDSEGHGIRWGGVSVGAGEPPSDEAETEGHLVRRASDDTDDELDAEAHLVKRIRGR